MKKLLSLLMAVVMVASMIVPMTVSAGDAVVDPTYGTRVYYEEFDDASKVQGWLNDAKGNVASLEEQTEMEDDAYFKVEDDKLKVNVKNTSTVDAFRFPLYDVADDVDLFTVVMNYKTVRANASGTANAIGLLIADNGVENYKNGDVEVDGVPGTFQLFWSRVGAKSGIQSYGDDKTETRNDFASIYTEGENYQLIITVDYESGVGRYTLINVDLGVETIKNVPFVYEKAGNAKNEIGLLFTGVKAEIDNVIVYTRMYENGELLFSEDFSDYTKISTLTKGKSDLKTGYRLPTYYAPGKYYTWNQKQGEANIVEDCGNTLHNKRPRYLLYDIPSQIKKFSVSFDFTMYNNPTALNGDVPGIGLILSDTGVYGDGTSTNTACVGYQVVYCPNYSGSKLGVMNVVKTGDSASNDNLITLGETPVFSAGDRVKVTVFVDEDSAETKNASFEIYNKTTNTVIHSGTFEYNPCDYKRSIGVWIGDGEYGLDQLNVYYGTREAEYTGSSVSVGSDIALTYSAKINDAGLATAGLTTKFFRDGDLVEEVSGEINGATATFKFDRIAPNQMDKEIVAELWGDGVKLDTRTYSVKQNLICLIETSKETEIVTFAKDALVYGGAAQAYKGETDTINNGKYTSSVTAIPTPGTLEKSGTDITAAGLYFDYANKIYFKVNAGNGATVTINGTPYTAEIKDGKIYTDYIAASELGTDFTIVVTSSNGTSTLTYSVYDYIARKCADDSASDAIKNLAKALYSYAKSAEALA